MLLLLCLTLPFQAWAQKQSVTGVITEENGDPVIGATVLERGQPTESLQILTENSRLMSILKARLLFLMSVSRLRRLQSRDAVSLI